MNAYKALVWMRLHNVRVRFFSNKTVEITLNHSRRRRKTLAGAILAHDPNADKIRCNCGGKPHSRGCAFSVLDGEMFR